MFTMRRDDFLISEKDISWAVKLVQEAGKELAHFKGQRKNLQLQVF